MSSEPDQQSGEREDQLQDKQAFQQDPRGGEEVSDQQPETQPPEQVPDDTAGHPSEDQPTDRAGSDEPGQATGNPENAG